MKQSYSVRVAFPKGWVRNRLQALQGKVRSHNLPALKCLLRSSPYFVVGLGNAKPLQRVQVPKS
jgi:hypothetical protein